MPPLLKRCIFVNQQCPNVRLTDAQNLRSKLSRVLGVKEDFLLMPDQSFLGRGRVTAAYRLSKTLPIKDPSVFVLSVPPPPRDGS